MCGSILIGEKSKQKLFSQTQNPPLHSQTGILTACASISATLGLFLVYLLNTFMPWRMVGLICLAVPLITMIAICFVSTSTGFLFECRTFNYLFRIVVLCFLCRLDS